MDIKETENLVKELNKKTWYVYTIRGNAEKKFALFTQYSHFDNIDEINPDLRPLKQVTDWVDFSCLPHIITGIMNFNKTEYDFEVAHPELFS